VPIRRDPLPPLLYLLAGQQNSPVEATAAPGAISMVPGRTLALAPIVLVVVQEPWLSLAVWSAVRMASVSDASALMGPIARPVSVLTACEECPVTVVAAHTDEPTAATVAGPQKNYTLAGAVCCWRGFEFEQYRPVQQLNIDSAILDRFARVGELDQFTCDDFRICIGLVVANFIGHLPSLTGRYFASAANYSPKYHA
jgi:hypothetical protein